MQNGCFPSKIGTEPFRSQVNRTLAIRSLELLLHGLIAPWPFRSLAFSLPGTFAPRNESSMNFRSVELSFHGAFALLMYI